MAAVIAHPVSGQSEIVRSQAPLGAETNGLDLTRPVDDVAFACIHRARVDRHVLVLPEQRIMPTQQLGFSRRPGPLQIQVRHQFQLASNPEILIIFECTGRWLRYAKLETASVCPFPEKIPMHAAATASASVQILHLGMGAFHRAHQAVYLQRLHDAGDHSWSLASGNIRSDMRSVEQALRDQGGAYTLETVTPEGQRRHARIRAIREVIPWDAQLSSLIAAGASKATRIISFTVTEAGYYLDAQDRLDLNAPDLQADLDAARQGLPGTTLYGTLTAMLRARMHAMSGAVTLLCCDNLRYNGRRSRAGLLQFLDLVGDGALLEWVQNHTRSPNCMVDRITPRPVPDVAARISLATGQDDRAALMAESFIQWVIEDDFIHGRPAWEKAGVEMVASVTPYEEAKIRLLNATHSCIAWAGALAGYRFIHEGVRDMRIRAFAREYATHAAIPALGSSPIDLPAYRDVVLARFGNDAILDTNQRVASDSFAKIPGFITPTIADLLRVDADIDAVAMLPAFFLAFLRRWARQELPFGYQDRAMDGNEAKHLCAAEDPVTALAANRTLFGKIAGDPRLVAALRAATKRVGQFEASCARSR